VRAQQREKGSYMFKVAELSFELIEDLRPLVAEIRRRDRSLADQLMRAASSIGLNVAEGQKSDGGNMRARFFTAAGSASETRAALRVAVGWRHIQPQAAAAAQGRLNQIIAILWKLTHR
jgi:four helix bundle protein